MAVMRANYDKPWRCPAWSGPALRGPRKNAPACDGGSLAQTLTGERLWQYRSHRCPLCGTLVLPSILVWVDFESWKAGILWRRLARPARNVRHYARVAAWSARAVLTRTGRSER